MIVRVWRGRAAASNREAYANHFRRNVLPEIRAIEGFKGASLLQQDQAGEVEFVVMTRWASLDAIRAFAGEDIVRAVVEPAARAALLSYDETVQHYEVVEEEI